LYNDKKVDESNKIIEDVLVFSDDLLSKIHQAKSKKDYPAIRKAFDEKVEHFIAQIDKLA
jgi:hypothetical protein